MFEKLTDGIKYRNMLNSLLDDVILSSGFMQEITPKSLGNGVTAATIVNYDTKEIKIFVDKGKLKIACKGEFVLLTVALFHELRHAYQYKEMLLNTASVEILCSHLASSDNRDYYLQNYKYDLAEIDAERFGVIHAYDYLRKIYPDKESFELVLEYLHSKKEKRDTLYLLINVDSISNEDSLRKAFDEVYEKAKCQEYSLLDVSYLIRRTKDPAAQYIVEHDHEDIYYRFLDMKNKLERDKIYTAVYIHEHPEYKYLIENNSNIDILELEKLLADS
ncbi:hypothetical protein [Butyrivibrio sp.]|uniref:hypothetical protein n=1 Tax=Butyrivibrio sp. TaxID=28121 RepID=UPI0025BB6B8B|nr:hypothetical protein [Butyrivibrio sp.]MBQ9302758.1 hypothetical protein [Butyrivibrio sp.]